MLTTSCHSPPSACPLLVQSLAMAKEMYLFSQAGVCLDCSPKAKPPTLYKTADLFCFVSNACEAAKKICFLGWETAKVPVVKKSLVQMNDWSQPSTWH